jgi:hypothetical protein
VYNIYHKFSKDRDFYIFAIGMFSFFDYSLLVACSKYISLFLGIPHILYSHWPEVPIGIWIFIAALNLFLFAYKGKHVHLFSRYLEVQSTKKDVICFFLSAGSIFLFFYAMLAK